VRTGLLAGIAAEHANAHLRPPGRVGLAAVLDRQVADASARVDDGVGGDRAGRAGADARAAVAALRLDRRIRRQGQVADDLGEQDVAAQAGHNEAAVAADPAHTGRSRQRTLHDRGRVDERPPLEVRRDPADAIGQRAGAAFEQSVIVAPAGVACDEFVAALAVGGRRVPDGQADHARRTADEHVRALALLDVAGQVGHARVLAGGQPGVKPFGPRHRPGRGDAHAREAGLQREGLDGRGQLDPARHVQSVPAGSARAKAISLRAAGVT